MAEINREISHLEERLQYLTIEFQEAHNSVTNRLKLLEDNYAAMESKIHDRLSLIETSLQELTKSTSLISPVHSSDTLQLGSDSPDDRFREQLVALKQTASVVTYILEFETLALQVKDLNEETKERIFMDGLKPEVQDLVKFLRPKGLEEVLLAATRSEETVLCKVVAQVLGQSANQP